MFDKSPVGIESKLSGLGAKEVHALQRAADVNL